MQKNSTNHRENANNNATESEPEIIVQSEDKIESEIPQINYLEEIKKYKDSWMRVAADLENVKRIAKQDLEKAAFYSIEKFAKDLVSVFENLSRASDLINEEDTKINNKLQLFKEGIEITKQEMLSALEKNNVRRIFPKGEKFDHNLHQAIAQIDSEQEAGTIVDVVQAGYVIKDRLLKPAMVVVAKLKG